MNRRAVDNKKNGNDGIKDSDFHMLTARASVFSEELESPAILQKGFFFLWRTDY